MYIFGVLLAALLGIYYDAPLRHIINQCWVRCEESKQLSLLLSTYMLGLLVIFALPLLIDVHDWDKNSLSYEVFHSALYGKYRWAYLFLMIFPVGFCCCILLLRKWSHTGKVAILSSLIGITIWGLVEKISVSTTQREFDAFLLTLVAGVVLLSVLTSWILSKTVRVS